MSRILSAGKFTDIIQLYVYYWLSDDISAIFNVVKMAMNGKNTENLYPYTLGVKNSSETGYWKIRVALHSQ